MNNEKTDRVSLLLKYTFGTLAIVAGLDKFFNVLTVWDKYLNPYIANIISPTIFLTIVGIIEIIAGIIVLSRYTRFGAYVVSVWLVLISINLVTFGYYDIAIRDLTIAIGAFSLAKIYESQIPYHISHSTREKLKF